MSKATAWDHYLDSAVKNSDCRVLVVKNPSLPALSHWDPHGAKPDRGSHEATHNAGGLDITLSSLLIDGTVGLGQTSQGGAALAWGGGSTPDSHSSYSSNGVCLGLCGMGGGVLQPHSEVLGFPQRCPGHEQLLAVLVRRSKVKNDLCHHFGNVNFLLLKNSFVGYRILGWWVCWVFSLSQYFKYFTTLFSCIFSEKLNVILIFVTLQVRCFSPLASFKIFFFWYFCSLCINCRGIVFFFLSFFFLFYTYSFYPAWWLLWVSWICGVMSNINLGKFSVIVAPNFSFLTSWYSHYMYVTPSVVVPQFSSISFQILAPNIILFFYFWSFYWHIV